ncbi:glycosyltransferase family 4 protein [Salibacteraceae bacterium]|nr:glycosyltransferase family 4 protein [Salibacteraceae bacterium]MDB9709772.1 glycosyltransferase family 4 protein [Salibacteraceae bacterium]HAQ69957.1 glycosyltransferase WbuB [Flavobacteriales bacterium]
MKEECDILIVSNYYDPELGAAPKRISAMARGFVERGNSVRVLCPMPNYPKGRVFGGYRNKLKVREFIDGVCVDRIFIYPSKSQKPFVRLLSMLSFSISLAFYLPFLNVNRTKLILIQSPPLFVSFTAVFLSNLFFKKKICLNVSDLWPQSAVELNVLKPGRMHNILLNLESYIYKKSDLILGQSTEILEHIKAQVDKPSFLYRNLLSSDLTDSNRGSIAGLNKVVYAGLLGYAQGVFELCKRVDFKSLGLEFHIYGMGMEEEQIRDFCQKNTDLSVFFHGAYHPNDLKQIYSDVLVALVPLSNRIIGAVPSKIFELIQFEVPIIFSGGGEGAEIVRAYKLGLTVPPGNIEGITESLEAFRSFNKDEFDALIKSIRAAKANDFNFNAQFNSLIDFAESN